MSGFWLRGLLDPATARELRAALDAAPHVDGKVTAHGPAREAKDNLQLAADAPLGRELGARLAAALNTSDAFRVRVMPRMIVPFAFARYEPGMRYGDHVDQPVMGTQLGPLRTDLSLTVFLSDASDYDGGELRVLDGDTWRSAKGAAGDAYCYPSGNIHRVEPVTRGRRVVALTWVQSLVADPEERELLGSLAMATAELHHNGVSDAQLLPLRAVHTRLARRWSR